MNITELPIEILIKIFKYLSRYDEVSLVNKLFYTLACEIRDPNVCLRLDDRLFKYNWMPSIKKSTRKISKVDICFSLQDARQVDASCRAMISIIRRYGDFITRLKIIRTSLTITEFLAILLLIPNVEHLVLKRLRVRKSSKRCRTFVRKNDLNLHKLKIMKFQCQDLGEKDKFLAVFDRLPAGVLTELELDYFNIDDLVVLFERQANIKKLEVTRFVLNASSPVHIFDNLQLHSLTIFAYSVDDYSKILSKQTQLKKLSIRYTDRSDTSEYFKNCIGHVTELETLLIYNAPSPTCIAIINKMKRLKELSVYLNRNTTLTQVESLTKYPNVGITSITIDHNSLNCSLVRALAKSLTKLRVLKFYGYDDCGTVANEILKNFNFVEILQINGFITSFVLNKGDCANPKLTELIAPLPKNVSKMYLSKLMADYPNLKKFKINYGSITSSQFRQILNGFNKLESLTFNIKSAVNLTVDDLNYLIDHKNNLKFISLNGMTFRFTDDLKRCLSKAFGSIFCTEFCTGYSYFCIMAVDRYTMCREARSPEKAITSYFV